MTKIQFTIENTKNLVTLSDIGNEYRLDVSSIDESVENIPSVNLSEVSHLHKDITIIDSILSGIGRNEDQDIYRRIIEPLFQLLGIKHRYLVTQNKNSVKEFAKSLDPSMERTIIFLSGDTSISEFVNDLPNAEQEATLNIIIIPCGTGNSLSLSLGADSTIKAVANILFGSKIPFNLYQATFPKGSNFLLQDMKTEIKEPLVFTTVLSWAFHASIVADSDTKELRKFGIERFKMAAMKNLEQEQNYKGSIMIDDTSVNGPFAYWLVTGATRFEPTFEILPHGDIGDDSLYMVAVSAKYGSELLDIMKEVYDSGRHIENEKVTYIKITKGQKIKLKLGADSKNRFCLDGSIILLPELECEITIESVGNLHKKWSLFLLS
ncbi:uncharacterized protein AC631_01154 [Debaryomyces fabryi]|uniref:DAGKc domain-containing protein n=1 Tax=Debaryomyces fabryi TaxID=58627 RepID=A0A0V1Q4F8_9ASCO|nr:uncharacterized protein AC631_01154 [Debaryomyces fabryi]KSA03141.1 hypothetical protein AC631_01154 [Debaryomyces fabryi]CUM46021.1 unnamed protein product [Debaryomyces fabryi]